MDSPTSETFRGRNLLKIVLVFFWLVWAGAGVGGVVFAGRLELNAATVLSVALYLGFGAYLAFLSNRTFSTLTIDEQGVRMRGVVTGRQISWDKIGKITYWEEIQRGRTGPRTTPEPFADISDQDGQRCLLLKSTYPHRMFELLLTQARQRGIEVDGDIGDTVDYGAIHKV